METETSHRLVEFLKENAGDHLRGVLHYTDEDYQLVYLREDLTDRYSETDIERFTTHYERMRRANEEGTPFELGSLHCTTRFYDDALLFHFTQGEDAGTVITLNPAAGRDVVTFVTDCLKLLYADSPQTIREAPTWLSG